MTERIVEPDREVLSKSSALSAGLKRYYTGVLCGKGHNAERYVNGGHCCECLKQASKTKSLYHEEWRKKNIEKSREYVKKHRRNNPGYVADHSRKRREKNGETIREGDRERYSKNKIKYSIKNRAYRKSNPEIFATHARNRRSAISSSYGTHTAQQIRGLMVHQEKKCAYCRSDISRNYHADHIIPISRGGGNDINNIQLLCPTCNLRKGKLDHFEFQNRQLGG